MAWALAALAADAAAWWAWRWRVEHRFDSQFRAAAARYGVPPSLVKAVAWRESRFDPDARGSKGELGLMQIMEAAALEWAAADRAQTFEYQHVLDPATNTLAGAFYLGRLLRRYRTTDNPVCYALADYNAGRGNVIRWMHGPGATNSGRFLAQITYPSTRSYVESVIQRGARYSRDFQ